MPIAAKKVLSHSFTANPIIREHAMKPTVATIAILCVTLFAATGCNTRQTQIELEELHADRERLASEVTALSQERDTLAEQRDKARAENQRLRAHLEGVTQQLKNIKPADLPTNFYAIEDGIAMGQDFAFKKGSAELNTEAVNSIRQLASLLNGPEYADTVVVVAGHTDTTPVVRAQTKEKFGDNWGLSAMRSAAVVSALETAGVAPTRIRGSFRGEHAPAASNATSEGKAANRRVEIFLQIPAAN